MSRTVKADDPLAAGLVERLRRCASIAGSGDKLAEMSEIPRRTLESYLSGATQPKASRLAAIAKVTGVNLHWLITGEELSGDIGDIVSISQLSLSASAGHGALVVNQEAKRYLVNSRILESLRLRSEDAAAITATGDSMSPTIEDGETLIVDKSDDVQTRFLDNKIYVFSVGDESFVKRLRRDFGRLIAVSDNPVYPEREIPAELPFRIIGRVRWIGKAI